MQWKQRKFILIRLKQNEKQVLKEMNLRSGRKSQVFQVKLLFSPAGCFYWTASPMPSVCPWVPMQLKWQWRNEEEKQVNVHTVSRLSLPLQ